MRKKSSPFYFQRFRSLKRYGVFAIACSLFFSFISTAEEVARTRFSTLGIENGLSQSTVLSIEQDSLGYIWLATQDGLNRYDGVGVEVFKHQPLNENTISSSHISRLLFDGEQTLWVLNSNGLDSIDINTLEVTRWTDKLTKLVKLEQDALLHDAEVWAISLNQDGSLAVLTDNAFATISKDKTYVERNQRVSDFIEGKDFRAMQTLEDKVFFIKDNCLYRINFVGSERKEICAAEDSKYVRIYKDEQNDQQLLLTRLAGFTVYHHDFEQLKDHNIVNNQYQNQPVEVIGTLSTEKGYWLATVLGLKYWDKAKEQVTKEFYAEFSDPYSISNNYAISLKQSNDGLFWLGTSFGVNYWNDNEQFIHLLQKREVVPFKRNNTVTSIQRDYKGELWIGTDSSGLYKYSSNYGVLSHLPELMVGQEMVPTNFISDVLEDRDKNLWIVSATGVFIRPFGQQNFIFLTEFNHESDVLDLLDLYTLVEDRNGNIWLGGQQRFFKVSKIDPLQGAIELDNVRIENFSDKLPASFLKSTYGIYTLYEDLQGYIWIGGSKGLLRFNPLNSEVNHYQNIPEDVSTISSSDVNVIYEDLLGVLWIGTVSGLNRVRYDIDGNIYFQRVTTEHGFINDYICSILSDDKGHLWVSTANGLVKYHPDKGNPINYTFADGLQYNEFFTKADFADENGYLYFGGLNGISYFKPSSININKGHRRIKITSVKQNGEKKSVTEFNNHFETQVDAETYIDIEFKVFDLYNAKNLEYRYRIENLSDSWIELGKSRKISLHHPSQEQLTVFIQMRHEDGSWNKNEVSLMLNIRKGFWSSSLGFGIYLFLLLLAVVVVSLLLYRAIKSRLMLKDLLIRKEQAKNQMLINDKKSLLYQVEDLQYSISEQKYHVEQVENKLERALVNDQLTGFKTKYYLRSHIANELSSVINSWKENEHLKGIYLGVFAVDIDNLALINKQHGSLCGNEVIKQVAESIRTICYGTDILVRWEGATMVILSRGIAKREQMLLAEKLRNLIASRKFDLGNGSTVDATCSIGFTRFPFIEHSNKPLTWEQIMHITEKALWVAKKNSRNAWVGIFSNQFTRRQELHTKLSHDLPALIASGQLDYVSSIPKSKKLVWQ